MSDLEWKLAGYWYYIKIVCCWLVLFSVIIGTLISLIGFIEYSLDNVPTVCYVEGKKVYEGRSACINVDSSGSSTTVSITGGYLCLFPRAYYVSNDVKLEGVKHE